MSWTWENRLRVRRAMLSLDLVLLVLAASSDEVLTAEDVRNREGGIDRMEMEEV